MTISKTLSLAFLLGSAALPAAAQDYFISNAKLVTNSSDGIIEDADILIRSGTVSYTHLTLPTIYSV